jgi:hypothetical protein
LAANGESLRRKVLFVASSLLEQHKSTSEGHNYVSDFLAVVSARKNLPIARKTELGADKHSSPGTARSSMQRC